MSAPSLVGKTTGTAHAANLTITRSTTGGNALLIGIALADGSDTVSAISDNLGSNLSGSAINQYEFVAGINMGASRLEMWLCRNAQAITSLTIALQTTGSPSQYISACVAEYQDASGVSTYGSLQVNKNQNSPTTYNTGHSQKYENQHTQINLTLEQPAPSAASTIVGFFSMVLSAVPSDTQAFALATSGTKQEDMNTSSPYANLALLDNSTAGTDGDLSIGVNQDQYILGGDPNDYDYLSASTLQGIYIVLTDSMVLTHEPGFSDVSTSNFASGSLARGLDLIKVSENAAFGMARLEVFYGEYSNGQTVNLPVSPIDGYQYQRDELTYIWSVRSTVNPSSGWASAEQALWIANWFVDQTNGKVFTEEWYAWIHGAKQPVQSSDGILSVFTVAQRQATNLNIASIPSYTDLVDSTFAVDTAYRQDILQGMCVNSKFAAVNCEVIYMGEYVDGDVVAQPISPADGYVYPIGSCSFVTSMRWNTTGGAYTQPSNYLFMQGFASVVDSGGNVSITVKTWDPGSGTQTQANFGRVAVFAICSRTTSLQLYTGGILLEPLGSGNTNFAYDFGHWGGTAGTGGFPTAVKFRNGAGDNATSLTIQWIARDNVTVMRTDVIPVVAGTSGFIFPPALSNNINITAVTGTFANGLLDVYNYVSLTFTSLANQFKEVDPSQLLMGNTIPAKTLKQINDNIREACVVPEVFGPASYTDGQTVSLPTSPIDGYQYSRSELFYLYSWDDFEATTSVRIIVGEGFVNASTGVVTCTLYELPHGGSGVSHSDGSLSVTVVAVRNGTGRLSGATTSTINSGQVGTDALAAGQFFVNGS
jgi:hypothetical protein